MKFIWQSIFFVVFCLLSLTNCTKKSDPINPTTNGPGSNQDNLPVGASANDMLSANKYASMTFQIVAVEGYELKESVVTSFSNFLKTIINKPDGFVISTKTVKSADISSYSLESIINVESNYRDLNTTNDMLSVFIFISDGNYEEENVLGLAYGNTSFAIMGGRIEEATGGIGQPSEDLVMQTVLRHEMCHLLGLVNVGTPMVTNHQDVAHGSHCDETDCLMYYAVETGDFLSNLIGVSTPPELDSQCKADLKANGGK